MQIQSSYFLNIKKLLLILILVSNNSILASHSVGFISESKFKIVFVADVRVAANKEWLKRVATDWGATGICLRVFWGHADTDSVPGADNWENLDKAIKTITENHFNNKKLDIYLRVCMGLQKPTWISPTNFRFVKDDFQIKYDNSIYNHQDYEKGIPDSEKYPLNFNSPKSQTVMKNFLREVLAHINKEFPDSVKARIKEIVPTFSTSDEAEYPFAAMCGYSSYETEEFKNYLKDKYSNSLSGLNSKWDPEDNWKEIKSWSEITPSKFKWDTYDNSEYNYANGRVDWINFRTKQLASFINSLAEIISSLSFEMGVQVGSIYDGLMERRGWVDPTRLFESADAIHVADIYQYSENFKFGAEYLSSICKFWTETNDKDFKPVQFSTETNWPNFYDQTPEFLSFYWKKQLVDYYNKGASAHYLVGWDVTPGALDKLKLLYEPWRKVLIIYSDKDLVKKENQIAVHLGVEQVFYNHNKQSIWNKRFALNDFVSSQYESITSGNVDNYDKDIVTNYMLQTNPEYLKNYSYIYFAEENGFMSEKAYLSLKQFLVEQNVIKSDMTELSDKDDSSSWYKSEFNENFRRLPLKIRLNRD